MSSATATKPVHRVTRPYSTPRAVTSACKARAGARRLGSSIALVRSSIWLRAHTLGKAARADASSGRVAGLDHTLGATTTAHSVDTQNPSLS